MRKRNKTRMISMRITEHQFQALEELSRRITVDTGFKITRASIILKLMEFGLPVLNRHFPQKEEKSQFY